MYMYNDMYIFCMYNVHVIPKMQWINHNNDLSHLYIHVHVHVYIY